MNTQTATTKPLTLEAAVEGFLNSLRANNRAELTLTTYQTDLSQFITWLKEHVFTASSIETVSKADITAYLAFLRSQRISGVTRAKKLASIRGLFRYLVEGEGLLEKSPAQGLETPKQERRSRDYFLPDEYRAMLSLAGASPRDYAILQVFLQTGIRVGELCELMLEDVDLEQRLLRVRNGKGMVAREVPFETKAAKALANWLKARKEVLSELGKDSDQLFLNQYGAPIGCRGVKKLVTKYRQAAGVTKKLGCHGFRHSFGTLKNEMGVSPFVIRELMGHARYETTQQYVHPSRQNIKKVTEATSL